jgi:TPR repeat protein
MMYKIVSLRTLFVLISATLCGVAFSLAQAQTVSSPSPVSFQAGLQAAQSGDALQALRHFQVLAAQGHDAAQYNLGLMYLNGIGLPVDVVQARYWLGQAARQGYVKAQVAMEKLP